MHPQLAQSEAAHGPHPGVFRSRKYKRRHRQKRKKESEGLTAENRYLKEIIEELISRYSQVPARDLCEQEISDSPSVRQNVHVQDHQRVDSDLGRTTEELDGLELNDLLDDGLELNDLLDDLLSEEVSPKNSYINRQNKFAEFLQTLDDDVASSIDFPDFMICLDGEQKMVGKYSFPLSLVPTVQKIINVYGDVSAASLMNSNVTGKIYLFFCATIQEMEVLQLHQITEKKMLKWRDAIKDALRINLKVDFAMQHLKRVARAYFGSIGSQVLQRIDEKLNSLYREHAETYEEFKDCLADAKDFFGKSVGTGLFP